MDKQVPYLVPIACMGVWAVGIRGKTLGVRLKRVSRRDGRVKPVEICGSWLPALFQSIDFHDLEARGLKILAAMETDEKKPRLHFKNPPIVEAVIAISIPPVSGPEPFQQVAGEMRSAGYVKSEVVMQHRFEVKVADGQSTGSTLDSPVGVKHSTDDGLYVVQFLTNSYIFSRVGRYDSWEVFRDEARKIWEIYSRVVDASSALGVGVRYINKVFIPFGADPKEYVRANIDFPNSISPTIAEMFMRVGMPIQDPPGKFIHTQALLPMEKDGFATILFDNDFQFSTLGKPIDYLWQLLETVRDVKDHYFMELTTPKLQETFND